MSSTPLAPAETAGPLPDPALPIPSAADLAREPLPQPEPIELLGIEQADVLAKTIRVLLDRVCLPLAAVVQKLVETRAWTTLGFARQEDFARERLERSGRWLRDLARLGRAVEAMPPLASALGGADGGKPLGQVAAVEIASVATPATLDRWIERGRSVSIHVLREDAKKERVLQREEQKASRESAGAVRRRQEEEWYAHEPHAWHEEELGEGRSPDDPPSTWRMRLSPQLIVAFEQAAELYRAVVGHDAPLRAAVEALAAESSAGPLAGLAGQGDRTRPRDTDSAPKAPQDDAEKAAPPKGTVAFLPIERLEEARSWDEEEREYRGLYDDQRALLESIETAVARTLVSPDSS